MSAREREARRNAEFRFYEELNDFLPAQQRKRAFAFAFIGTPSVKDAVEALGVPHTQVDLILVDGESVGFDCLLKGDERVAVYPVFERLDISPLTHLRPAPLRRTRFVLDVHLGRLARYLRLIGLDALYRNDYDAPTIVLISRQQQRIILTRDRGMLKTGAVTHGYWLREIDPREQLREVVRVFDLKAGLKRGSIKPFTRCLRCNGELRPVDRSEIVDQLPLGVRDLYEAFVRCAGCDKVYWAGTHYQRMRELVGEWVGS
jgi:uncharacterized protein